MKRGPEALPWERIQFIQRKESTFLTTIAALFALPAGIISFFFGLLGGGLLIVGLVLLYSLYRAIGPTFIVQHYNGYQCEINGRLNNVRELLEAVYREITPILLEKTLPVYNAQHYVDFGKLRVDEQGIKLLKRSVHWQDIAHVDFDINTSRLKIVRKDSRAEKWILSNSPNGSVIASLAELILNP